ncbi:hypothetical protein TNCV_3510301 [Trichonephila clavipes]|nr:hypothetical protein TNCV_3510301 [Trichonephila clavipes]
MHPSHAAGGTFGIAYRSLRNCSTPHVVSTGRSTISFVKGVNLTIWDRTLQNRGIGCGGSVAWNLRSSYFPYTVCGNIMRSEICRSVNTKRMYDVFCACEIVVGRNRVGWRSRRAQERRGVVKGTFRQFVDRWRFDASLLCMSGLGHCH